MHCSEWGIESISVVLCGVTHEAGECPTPRYVAVASVPGTDAVQIGIPKLLHLRRPPYPTGRLALAITFDVCTMAHCHLALGWQLPERIIDLGVEFRNHVNGLAVPCGTGLVGALAWFGLPLASSVRSGTLPQEVLDRLNAITHLFFAMQSVRDFARKSAYCGRKDRARRRSS